ncbi:MAG: dTDP-4-dehydrorhamnose 3,5-epimerase [Kiritimatiellae bacterium]|nr:dTDP-4-dehydrorhamnose 3,5-epimerase [Kiritimatiellia bacterium]MDW8459016.1 dTDP-4-dehydrorhamnose 3,5-epimerase [Verrucomicrobiota bacterium]
MIFTPTHIPGVWIVDVEPREDPRGFFARTWCRDEFARHGLDARLVQCNISFNRSRHTLRGMHYQAPPHEEPKLVRCTRGRIWDVALDLRRDSPTYCRWVAIELSAENRRALFIPTGCAHGFLTLEDNSEVFYQMGEAYRPEAARGVRWNDPAFGIKWPTELPFLSEKDASYPDFAP